jgi:putative intracellular protease/amidase
MAKLDGERVAILAADMVEQVELIEPWEAVKKEGAEVEPISIHDGEIQGFNHFEPADIRRGQARAAHDRLGGSCRLNDETPLPR